MLKVRIKAPLVQPDVEVELDEVELLVLTKIKRNLSTIDAIRVLRWKFPDVGLKDAKEYIDTL